MAEETQYTANTGFATLNAANTSLAGGTINTDIWSVITGASNGTLIKTVTIKAQGDTSEGMVRLFIYDGSSVQKLIAEVEIPAVIKSSEDPAFEITIPVDFALKSGWQLLASTQIGNTFNVIAEGLNWAYYTTSVRPESSKYTANNGVMQTINTSNSNLDGATGTYSSAIITGASNGTQVQCVTIKAQGNTSAGMIRLFVTNGGSGATNVKLLKEIPVIATTQSGTAHSFSARVDFGGKGFALKSGYTLIASTQVGGASGVDTFNLIAEGLDWAYPA